jgi:hypothetical protein
MSIQIERWSNLTSPDAENLKARLRDEGYSVFQWSDAPGTKYGPHVHPEDRRTGLLAANWNCASATKPTLWRPAIETSFPPVQFILHLSRVAKR